MQMIGKYLMVLGVILLIIGAVIFFGGQHLQWFGRLPGDIRIERENYRFYLPITTMILMSIILTLLINIIRKFF